MATPQSQVHLLRTAFQSCRPRSSLHRSVRQQHSQSFRPFISNQTRHHSTEPQSTPTSRSSSTAPPSTESPTTPTSSVSATEVSHFSRLASSWWDPHGPSRLLHLMNPLRHDFIATCLASSPSQSQSTPRSYLDIGCGGGIFASSAARHPHTSTVTAIDPTPEVIAVARQNQRSDPALSPPKLRYLNCAIEDLTRTEGEHTQYDIISLFEVIEHIDQPSSFLATALTHLKPGGWLVGSTISRHPVSYVTTKLIAEAPVVGVVPAGTHDWNKYIKPGELRAWFGKRMWLEQGERTQEDGREGKGEMPRDEFGPVRIEGVVYVPFLGWRFVKGSEEVGNYFFGVQKLAK